MIFIESSHNPYDTCNSCQLMGHDGYMPSHTIPLSVPLKANGMGIVMNDPPLFFSFPFFMLTLPLPLSDFYYCTDTTNSLHHVM